MSTGLPAKGRLTTYLFGILVVAFADADINPKPLVGDAIAPEQSGWPDGQPGKGTFVPYAVLKTLATQRPTRQPVGDATATWVLNYAVTGWGAVREQADMVADLASSTLDAVGRVPANGPGAPLEGFGIQNIEVATLGSTERDDAVSPPLWSRTDIVSVYLARARSG